MPQIFLYEWKIIFSLSLLHKTPTPCLVGLLRDCKTSCNLRRPSFQALEYTDKTLGLACSAAGAVALLLGCLSGQESCSREYVIKVSCIRSLDILTLGPIE